MGERPANPPVLDYAIPPALDHRLPIAPAEYRFLPALLLCLPGILCWDVIFAGAWGVRWLLEPFSHLIGDWFIMALWALAIITAITSLIVYGRRLGQRKPWYVYICVVLNIIGLLFSAYIVFGSHFF